MTSAARAYSFIANDPLKCLHLSMLAWEIGCKNVAGLRTIGVAGLSGQFEFETG